jgi:hypothetical protein
MKTFVIACALSVMGSPARGAPLTIVGTDARGGAVRIDEHRGRVVLITLVSRYTRGELEKINAALAGELGTQVRLFTVVDFVGIPRLFHGYARRKVAESEARTPARLLVDDRGAWRSALGAVPDKRVDIIVLDAGGEVRGHFVGVHQVEEVRRLVRALRR